MSTSRTRAYYFSSRFTALLFLSALASYYPVATLTDYLFRTLAA